MTQISFTRNVRTGCNQVSRGPRSTPRFRALPKIRKVEFELVAIPSAFVSSLHMSAFDPKRTSQIAPHMPLFWGNGLIFLRNMEVVRQNFPLVVGIKLAIGQRDFRMRHRSIRDLAQQVVDAIQT